MLLLFSKKVPITSTDQLPDIGPTLGDNVVTVAKLMTMKGIDDDSRPPIRTARLASPNDIEGVLQITTPPLELRSTRALTSMAVDAP
jgi:hypothetical protein